METINNQLAGKFLSMSPCGHTYAELLRFVLAGQDGWTLCKTMTFPAKLMVSHPGAEVFLEDEMAAEFIRKPGKLLRNPHSC